mmetsp:Transcript_43669/g.69999  ORF Transcript_43669/g.69999 Transcript_43669/m.69999 type:complete len:208 (-) Transcript_43669:925-1548(-)
MEWTLWSPETLVFVPLVGTVAVNAEAVSVLIGCRNDPTRVVYAVGGCSYLVVIELSRSMRRNLMSSCVVTSGGGWERYRRLLWLAMESLSRSCIARWKRCRVGLIRSSRLSEPSGICAVCGRVGCSYRELGDCCCRRRRVGNGGVDGRRAAICIGDHDLDLVELRWERASVDGGVVCVDCGHSWVDAACCRCGCGRCFDFACSRSRR